MRAFARCGVAHNGEFRNLVESRMFGFFTICVLPLQAELSALPKNAVIIRYGSEGKKI